jgi:hypothetical protein
MNDEHARVGHAAMILASQKLASFDAEAIRELRFSDAIRLIEVGAKIERLARGESTERVGMREAMAWVDGFLGVALAHLPLDGQEAFLVDVDARLGIGSGSGG